MCLPEVARPRTDRGSNSITSGCLPTVGRTQLCPKSCLALPSMGFFHPTFKSNVRLIEGRQKGLWEGHLFPFKEFQK